jgi:tetratricopeptide (TPR) repeat protein
MHYKILVLNLFITLSCNSSGQPSGVQAHSPQKKTTNGGREPTTESNSTLQQHSGAENVEPVEKIVEFRNIGTTWKSQTTDIAGLVFNSQEELDDHFSKVPALFAEAWGGLGRIEFSKETAIVLSGGKTRCRDQVEVDSVLESSRLIRVSFSVIEPQGVCINPEGYRPLRVISIPKTGKPFQFHGKRIRAVPWDAGRAEIRISASNKTPEKLVQEGNRLLLSLEYEEALGLFKEAIELKPEYAEAYWAAGNCLARLKRRDEAVRYHEKYLKLAPNSPTATQIRKSIDAYYKSKNK